MSNYIDIEIKPPTKNDGLKYECKLCYSQPYEKTTSDSVYYCLEGRQTPIVITKDKFFNRFVVANHYVYGTVYCYKKYE